MSKSPQTTFTYYNGPIHLLFVITKMFCFLRKCFVFTKMFRIYESFHKSFHESFHKSFFELFFSASMKKRLQRLKEPTTAYPTSTYILRLFLLDISNLNAKQKMKWMGNVVSDSRRVCHSLKYFLVHSWSSTWRTRSLGWRLLLDREGDKNTL